MAHRARRPRSPAVDRQVLLARPGGGFRAARIDLEGEPGTGWPWKGRH
ncbi:hypothetical protein [Streptomyces sp. R41]|uniref:Uncharacterized protein n=1 Tax=Streptomyces sp. R41 TaxID=3238632 RepID=A0AB39RV66_9ACTN